MERRRDQRFPANLPVTLTLLGPATSGQPDVVEVGTVLDYSDRGMRVEVPNRIAAGAALRLDFNDQLLLAEVCYCQPTANGRWAVGVELQQSLKNLDDLSRLMRALVADPSQGLPLPRQAA